MRVPEANGHNSQLLVAQRGSHTTYPVRNHAVKPHKHDRYHGAPLVEPDDYIAEEADGTWSFTCRSCRLTLIGWTAEDRAEEQYAIHERTPGHAALARRA
jgi:hypothetical protein